MSEIDNYLANLDVTENSIPPFMKVLLDSGVSKQLIFSFTDLMKNNHSKPIEPAYHTLEHSVRTANLIALILDRSNHSLPIKHEIALIIAAMFHDADPEKEEGTPARVSYTLTWLEKNSEAHKLLHQLSSETGVTKEHIKALIKFTDFSLNPEYMHQVQKHAEALALAAHSDKQDVILTSSWGKILALADQLAMYVGSVDFAERSVKGLAREMQTSPSSKAHQIDSNIIEQSLLEGTSEYLIARIQNPHFESLPESLRENVMRVLRHFDGYKKK